MSAVAEWTLPNSLAVLAAIPLVWLYGRLRPGRPAELHTLWLVLLLKLLTPPFAGAALAVLPRAEGVEVVREGAVAAAPNARDDLARSRLGGSLALPDDDLARIRLGGSLALPDMATADVPVLRPGTEEGARRRLGGSLALPDDELARIRLGGSLALPDTEPGGVPVLRPGTEEGARRRLGGSLALPDDELARSRLGGSLALPDTEPGGVPVLRPGTEEGAPPAEASSVLGLDRAIPRSGGVAASGLPDSRRPQEISGPPMGTEGGAGAGTARFDGADLTRLLVAGWLVGSMVVLAHAAIAVLRQRQLTARSVPPSSALRVLAEELSEAYRMARPRLVVSSAVDLPFVACGLRPVIVWPAAFDAPYAVEPFRPVLAHELAHLRRRDPWVAWVELGALVVQWWNPLVWLIRARLHETRELACDALALRTAPGRRRDFAELLLGLAGAEPLPRWPVPRVRTAWMSRHALKRRLTMVFDDRVDGESTAVGRVLAGLAALMFVPAWSLGQAPPRAEATPPPVAPPAATAPTASAPVAATATPTDAPLPATAPSAFVRQQATAPTAAVLPEGIAASPEARQPVGSGATVAAANLPDAGSAGVAPGDVLQVVDLGPEEGMLRVLRVCPGVVDIEISREGQRVSLMRMATAVGAPVAVNPASEPEDRPPVASMPVRSAPAASPPAGVVISADGRFVRLTQPDGTTRVVPAERAAPVVAADPFAVAPSVESSPISGGSSPNLELHRELRYRVEMAEIELEEKRAELDLALQIAESEPTARSKHAVRVAELAVKRADIAYRRALGLFESAATVPAVPPPPTQPRR